METLERLHALEVRVGHLEKAVTDAKTQAGAARMFTEDAWAIVPRIHDRMELLAAGLHDVDALIRELAQTQKEHTATLDRHTATLDEHTHTLAGHTATLNEHTRLLDLILDRLDGKSPAR